MIKKISIIYFRLNLAAEAIAEVSELEPLRKNHITDDSYVRNTYNAGEIRVLGRGNFGIVILAEKMQAMQRIRIAVKIIET